MKRLTRKTKSGNYTGADTTVSIRQVYDKMGVYEDAEEQGLIPPCKVGDTVYKPNPITLSEIVEIQIESIFISASGINISGRTTKLKYSFCCHPSDFGKTVFLTQTKAKEALKRMEAENE